MVLVVLVVLVVAVLLLILLLLLLLILMVLLLLLILIGLVVLIQVQRTRVDSPRRRQVPRHRKGLAGRRRRRVQRRLDGRERLQIGVPATTTTTA